MYLNELNLLFSAEFLIIFYCIYLESKIGLKTFFNSV